MAKFAAGGKTTGKKDLAQIAMSYGNVYVAQVAMGANMTQTVHAFAEAEAHRGVSLILAYSPCIAHGIDMSTQMSHQERSRRLGLLAALPLRPGPRVRRAARSAARLAQADHALQDFAATEARFATLTRVNPDRAEELMRRRNRT